MSDSLPANVTADLPASPHVTPHDASPDAVEAAAHRLASELARQAGQLQLLLGSISQGVLMADERGVITRFNARLCELLDVDEPTLVRLGNLPALVRFQSARGDFGNAADIASGALGIALPDPNGQGVPPLYLRRTLTGRVLEVKTQVLPLGSLVRTFTDVTPYVEAQQDRERLNLLLAATQSLARVGGWEVDVLRDKVYWTDEVYRMLDTTPQSYTPSTNKMLAFFTPESAARAKAAIRAAAAHSANNQADPYDLELEMVTNTGRPIWVHARSLVVSQNGRVIKRTAVLQDITERKKVEADLRASEQHFREMTAQVPGMVFRIAFDQSGAGTYSFVSDGVRDLYGVTPDAVLADPNLLARFRHPDDEGAVVADLKAAAMSTQPLLMQFRIKLPTGRVKWLQVSSNCVSWQSGASVRAGIMVDITERKTAEAALFEAEERWKLALESTGDGVWDWHIPSGVEIYSKRFVEMYGYEEGEIDSRADAFDVLNHPDDVAQLEADRQAHFAGHTPIYFNQHRVRCKDGSYKWIMSRGMVILRDAQGRPVRMIGTHTDISRQKESEALVWQQANFDSLTGLPNRRSLRDRLERDITRNQAAGLQMAILFIDLDHFKEVNDTLGHDKGDLLLIEAARRIRERVRELDTVARMGGDEFTVVLNDVAAPGRTQRIAEGILTALATVFQLGDEQVFVSASIGVTTCPQDGTEVEALFKNADQALYVAKGAGRNRFSVFTPALQTAAQMRARLGLDLRVGLGQAQFSMAYQPIVELATGQVTKAESLLRWLHPTRGLISPVDFIPIAEATGLIIDIGDWAFHQVAHQAQIWRTTLHPKFQVSVNKSPAQFHHDGGSNQVWLNHMRQIGLPGEAITVEITEGLLLEASANVNRQLLEMRDAGIQVSLDDFGTGYSSLSYLQRFNIDTLKIDQSFIRNLVTSTTDLALCKAIIAMAHALGMKVVAEGIETQDQRDVLLAAGCDFGQGYWFARPMTATAFEAFMLNSRHF